MATQQVSQGPPWSSNGLGLSLPASSRRTDEVSTVHCVRDELRASRQPARVTSASVPCPTGLTLPTSLHVPSASQLSPPSLKAANPALVCPGLPMTRKALHLAAPTPHSPSVILLHLIFMTVGSTGGARYTDGETEAGGDK